MKSRPDAKQLALLLLIALGAMFVHGYHPFVEDAEIYVPGIEKALHPALFPYNDGFFASHAGLTLFPNLIAGSIRVSHLPLEWALLLWQFLGIFLLLLACWKIGRLAFRDPRAPWGGVALVAALLTIPVAGTALYIMDQYLNTRSLSTPAVMLLIASTIERRFWSAGLWAIFLILIHPLMAVFGLTYAIFALGMGSRLPDLAPESKPRDVAAVVTAFLLPFGLFPPATGAYRELLERRSYLFLLRWEWYEWVGIFAPMLLLWWFQRVAKKENLPLLDLLCRALIVFAIFFFAASVLITVPAGMTRFVELQPLRYLHLLYILMFTFAGGLLAQFVLKDRVWRWLVLFAPICAGMAFAETQLFPASPRMEWPGAVPKNDWVQAFVWIREHTPVDAYFALNPDHMALEGEDQHGFRAIAQRSMLADRMKDSGAATMFPALAETWRRQVTAQDGWQSFGPMDFHLLKQEFGVDWVVLQQPGVAGMDCPYQNKTVLVCRVP